MLCDLHSHHPSRLGEYVLVQDSDSVGLHPCDIRTQDMNGVINILVNRLENDDNKRIKAIGECGLDKLSTVQMDLQRSIFIQHIELSERFRLPLIIHCVRAIDELMAIRRQMRPTQPWIWHGFRGKPQQLVQLLNAGLYVSFGFRYNVQSLLQCPLDRLLLETDDDERPVSLLYNNVQSVLMNDPVRQQQLQKEDLTSRIFCTFQMLGLV